jgi:hypothetical protein
LPGRAHLHCLPLACLSPPSQAFRLKTGDPQPTFSVCRHTSVPVDLEMEERKVEEDPEGFEREMGGMKRMPMGVSSQNKAIPSLDGVMIRQRRSGGAMIVLVSAIFVIFFLLAYMSSPASKGDLSTTVVERPQRVDLLLTRTTERGLKSQSLVPILKSDSEVVTQSSFPVSVHKPILTD